ncbi:transcription initiation factor TFIID subunit A-domain-containing protein [Mycena floridula]|nr:transcription initiation factor TFIID subunit A-domain-containing protein [Mycena floridula]
MAEQTPAKPTPELVDIIKGLHTSLPPEQARQQLLQLLHSGKLTPQNIRQLQELTERYPPTNTNAAAGPSKPSMLKPGASETTLANQPPLNSDPSYPVSAVLNTTNPGPVQWPSTRPTLSGGLAAGRMTGTPAQIARPDDAGPLTFDDNRARRKNTPGDQSMRRTIQDLVASIDPNVKIDSDVEDLLLNIADEFIDSVTNFACRLAKHRNSDTLEIRDLQLHLERNHNIRIPGFAADETRISLSQSAVAPAPAATTKKTAQGTHMTLRSQRVAQVQQAKREGKMA